MLPETITLSFSDDGTVAASNHTYEKKTHDAAVALYNNQVVVLDPSLPPENMTLKIFEAKASSQFYGTRKYLAKFRKEKMCDTPTGEKLLPIIFEINISVPIGFTTADMAYSLGWVKSMLANSSFEDFYKYQRI